MSQTDPVLIEEELALTFTRLHNAPEGHAVWHLQVVDNRSRLRVLEANLTDEAFSRLMGAQADVKARGTIYRTANHGKTRENETYPVRIDRAIYMQEKDFKAFQDALQAQFDQEGEGWILQRERVWNGHRYAQGVYRFVRIRYVDP